MAVLFLGRFQSSLDVLPGINPVQFHIQAGEQPKLFHALRMVWTPGFGASEYLKHASSYKGLRGILEELFQTSPPRFAPMFNSDW
jgi:hypothetical protein